MNGASLRRVVLLTLPLSLLGMNAAVVLAGSAGGDFDTNVWNSAQAVLAGRSPYPPPDLATLIEPSFLYPPLLLALNVPLSVFGHDGARALFWILELAAVLGALRMLEIRDPRVYLCAVAAYPVWVGLALGNPTLLLLPALAAAWRWRDRWWAVGLAVGLIGAFKLILWPLGLWLLMTGRVKSAALAAGVAVGAVLLPWAMIGFAGLADYPTLLQIFGEKSGAPRSLTVSTLMSTLGAPSTIAHGLRWACGFAAVLGVVLLARRPDGDRRAFSLAIAAVLVISPVVERVYFALLLVPLAIWRPMFGPAWYPLLGLWALGLLPSGPLHTVMQDGQLLKSFGFRPSVLQLLVAIGFLVSMITLTSGPPRDSNSTGAAPRRAALRRRRAGPAPS